MEMGAGAENSNPTADGVGQSPEMRPLHPDQIWVLRIRFLILGLFLLVAALLIDFGLLPETEVPAGLLTGATALIGLAGLIVLPGRRYRAWGYREEEDELHIRHGVWIRVRTAVPFGRVQHIDVAQGPIERRFGLARLILHTAGTRSAQLPLPGLTQSEAEKMRDRIRARIRLDLL